MKGFLGKKIGMTRLVDETTGKMLPVTLVEIGKQVVTDIKTLEKHGYQALQISAMPLKKSTKTCKFKHVKEFRFKVDEKCDLNKNDAYGPETLVVGSKIMVASVSKGKGFTGRVRRFNQNCGPRAHGSKNYREMGATGCRKPKRTQKGWRMPGRMGNERVTVYNVPVLKVDVESGIVALKGGVAGAIGTFVEMKMI